MIWEIKGWQNGIQKNTKRHEFYRRVDILHDAENESKLNNF